MFLIRADGNAKIGAGHLMRCLTIGTELAKLESREKILFLCADEQSAELVRQHDFCVSVLGTDYREMESELPAWERLLHGNLTGATVILVDSYYVTDHYLEILKRFGTIVLMDDMGKKRYPVDAVINYNAFADREAYDRLYAIDGSEGSADGEKHCPAGVKLFIGSSYVPVREQFLNRTYKISDKVKSVLITTGGGDSENIAGKILEMIYEDTQIYHLIVGQFNPHFRELKQLEDSHANIHIHTNVTDMAGMMAAADLAITAGGSTIYELAVLGVPLICFSYAENQEALTEYIGSLRIAGFAGAFHRNPEATLIKMRTLFHQLIADQDLRRAYYEKEREMIDGYGATRLAQTLISLEGDMV